MTFILNAVLIADFVLQLVFRYNGYGVSNDGISFGLFPQYGRWISIAVYLCLIIWLLVAGKNGGWVIWLYSIILGGLGNLVPRLIFGNVWDYLYFPMLGFWFNISDVLITMGVTVFLWSEIATSSTSRNDGVY